jgi:hypothetical protein
MKIILRSVFLGWVAVTFVFGISFVEAKEWPKIVTIGGAPVEERVMSTPEGLRKSFTKRWELLVLLRQLEARSTTPSLSTLRKRPLAE